jgi:uncharacterized protein YcgI (DUF1989 family)
VCVTALEPTYRPLGPDSPLLVDQPRYDAFSDEAGLELVERYVLQPRTALAWPVLAGQICRIVAPEGPQVGDFNAWNFHNPRERFWASRTRQLHRAHVEPYVRFWSTLPYLRPMLTITKDTVDYGVDPDGARCHDLLGTRCDPYVNRMLLGGDFDFTCHSNLTRAIAPWGLTERDVHDVCNIFQVTGTTPDDQYYLKPCPAKAGDFLEFFAEIDLLCAMSCCPAGDESRPIWGPEAEPSPCRPLAVEVYKVPAERLEGWASPESPPYAGQHGLKSPNADEQISYRS